jgi:peptide/nickel transport system substrate-binding protein
MRAVDQTDYLRVLAGDAKNWITCYSFYACRTPMASEAGAEPLKNHSLEKAKELVKESGYKGEKIVLMHATDQRIVSDIGLVTGDLLRRLGLNVEVEAMDWGTLVTRRASKEPLDRGGWNVFDTAWNALDQLNPAVNPGLRADGEKAWFGWPSDPKIEELRDAWFAAPDVAAQQKTAAAIQVEAFDDVPYIPVGQFLIPTAFRKSIDGVIVSPVVVQWNIEKN